MTTLSALRTVALRHIYLIDNYQIQTFASVASSEESEASTMAECVGSWIVCSAGRNTAFGGLLVRLAEKGRSA